MHPLPTWVVCGRVDTQWADVCIFKYRERESIKDEREISVILSWHQVIHV